MARRHPDRGEWQPHAEGAATDTSGNVATSPEVRVLVDNDYVSPTASFTSPTSGATVYGTVTLKVNAADDRLMSQVRFLVDGTVVGTDSSPPHTFNWITKSVPDGTHTLTAEAVDRGGNVGVSAPITVTVNSDYTNPTLVITSPASGAIVGGVVPIQAEATDDRGIQQVSFFLNGQLFATDTTAPYRVDWDTGAGAEGSYTWRVEASDTSANVVSSELLVTVDQPGGAVFDPFFQAPTCATLNNVCDTTLLLKGRGSSESPASNTIDGCADGSGGESNTYPAVNRIKLSRHGEHFAEGRPARIDVFVNVNDYATEYIDLFYASDATHPSWTYLTTLRPGNWPFAQVLSTTYTLPAGSLQAVRAQYRVGGSQGPACSGGTTDDHDDIVFAVGPPTETVPPAVAVTFPVYNSWVIGQMQVHASAEDDELAVERVEFYVDGVLLGTDTSAPYTVNWDSTAAAGGPHTLTARAYDSAGRVGTSAETVVYRDVTPPHTAEVTGPWDGVRIRSTIYIQANASDDFGVKKVEFYIDNLLWGSDTQAPYESNWNTSYTTDGIRTLTVRAYDGSGNVRTSAGVKVTVDNVPPTAAMSTPAENATVGGTVQLSATASDSVGMGRVEFWALGGILLGTDTTAPYTASWVTTEMANGPINLTVKAYDQSGNVTPVYRTVTVDNTAPTVAITSPANGASVALSTTVQASAADNVGVAQVVFYDGTKVIGTDTTAPYSVNWSLLLVPKGMHTLTAKAYDVAGNVTTSAPISVKVN